MKIAQLLDTLHARLGDDPMIPDEGRINAVEPEAKNAETDETAMRSDLRQSRRRVIAGSPDR